MIKSNRFIKHVARRTVGIVMCGALMFAFAGNASVSTSVAKAAKKPTVSSKSVSLKEGESKKLSIKANGYRVKSVSVVSGNRTYADCSSSKKAVTIRGVMKGNTTVTTRIKAKKGKKTKTFTTKVSVKVSESPFFQECSGGLSIKVVDPTTLLVAFPTVVDYINQTRVRIHTSDGTQLIIAESGISSSDSGKTHTFKLMPPGATPGVMYYVEFMDRDETATFHYERKKTALYFKDAPKKAFKKVPFALGAKIGSLPLAANPYNQKVTYHISGGKDKNCFDVDEAGNLLWHESNGITLGLKKFEVEVTAETEQTELLEGATATIMCTVTLK